MNAQPARAKLRERVQLWRRDRVGLDGIRLGMEGAYVGGECACCGGWSFGGFSGIEWRAIRRN
jgi:hypothetical protein